MVQQIFKFAVFDLTPAVDADVIFFSLDEFIGPVYWWQSTCDWKSWNHLKYFYKHTEILLCWNKTAIDQRETSDSRLVLLHIYINHLQFAMKINVFYIFVIVG